MNRLRLLTLAASMSTLAGCVTNPSSTSTAPTRDFAAKGELLFLFQTNVSYPFEVSASGDVAAVYPHRVRARTPKTSITGIENWKLHLWGGEPTAEGVPDITPHRVTFKIETVKDKFTGRDMLGVVQDGTGYSLNQLYLCPQGAIKVTACAWVAEFKLKIEGARYSRDATLPEARTLQPITSTEYQQRLDALKAAGDKARLAEDEANKAKIAAQEKAHEAARYRREQEAKYVASFIKTAKKGTTFNCESNNGSASLSCAYPFSTEIPHGQNLNYLLSQGWSIATQVSIPQVDVFGHGFVKTRYVFKKM